LAKLGTDDDQEIAYQFSAQASRASRQELDEMFERMNSA